MGVFAVVCLLASAIILLLTTRNSGELPTIEWENTPGDVVRQYCEALRSQDIDGIIETSPAFRRDWLAQAIQDAPDWLAGFQVNSCYVGRKVKMTPEVLEQLNRQAQDEFGADMNTKYGYVVIMEDVSHAWNNSPRTGVQVVEIDGVWYVF